MIKYKNCLLIYWSGTGNSYRISTWTEKIAQQIGQNCHLKSVDQCNPSKQIRNDKESIVGIIFPTHFWGRYREPNTTLRHVSIRTRPQPSKN